MSPSVAVATGQFIILAGRGGGGFVVSSVTDTSGNVWTSLGNSGTTGNTATLFYCNVTTALTTSSTITVTYNAANTGYAIGAWSFDGIRLPLTSVASAQGTAVTTLNGGSITPRQYGGLNFTVLTHNGSATAISSPSGFTDVGSATRVTGAYAKASSMSSTATRWSWTTAANSSAISATFTPDGGDFLALF